MTRSSCLLRHFILLPWTLLTLLGDAAHFLWLCLCPPAALAAENLFLRKQLALYRERGLKPQRAPNTTRITLVWLGRWFDWRRALAVVQPATLIRWHRQGFRLFWRWKSTPGRPPIPPDLQVGPIPTMILLAKSIFVGTSALTNLVFKLVSTVNRTHFRLRHQYQFW
jgi:hypothetical protein